MLRPILTTLLLACVLHGAQAGPLISIIIDDIGNDSGRPFLDLPGKLTYAILPHTPYATHFAQLAHQQGREILLHLPMQAEGDHPLGPGGVTVEMDENSFRHSIRDSLHAIPYLSGVNNHMGSLLTRNKERMAWVMEELQRHGNLFFIDSATTRHTIAQQTARQHLLPNSRRDIFLDTSQEIESIRHQFELLLNTAKTRGTALAIGHPYPNTLRVLTEFLPHLHDHGIQLVPVSELITRQQWRNGKSWHVSSSPSPPAVKNWKP